MMATEREPLSIMARKKPAPLAVRIARTYQIRHCLKRLSGNWR
jgi:hypothetical protein